MCKHWKVNGFATERKDGEKFSDHRRRLFTDIEKVKPLGVDDLCLPEMEDLASDSYWESCRGVAQ